MTCRTTTVLSLLPSLTFRGFVSERVLEPLQTPASPHLGALLAKHTQVGGHLG